MVPHLAFSLGASILGLIAKVAASVPCPWLVLEILAISCVAYIALRVFLMESFPRVVTGYGIVSYVLGAMACTTAFSKILVVVNWVGWVGVVLSLATL